MERRQRKGHKQRSSMFVGSNVQTKVVIEEVAVPNEMFINHSEIESWLLSIKSSLPFTPAELNFLQNSVRHQQQEPEYVDALFSLETKLKQLETNLEEERKRSSQYLQLYEDEKQKREQLEKRIQLLDSNTADNLIPSLLLSSDIDYHFDERDSSESIVFISPQNPSTTSAPPPTPEVKSHHISFIKINNNNNNNNNSSHASSSVSIGDWRTVSSESLEPARHRSPSIDSSTSSESKYPFPNHQSKKHSVRALPTKKGSADSSPNSSLQNLNNLRGATIYKLIEKIIPSTSLSDKDFALDLILGYHSFLTSDKLLDLLILRYLGPASTNVFGRYSTGQSPGSTPKQKSYYFSRHSSMIRSNVSFILLLWIETIPSDWMTQPYLTTRALDFIGYVEKKGTSTELLSDVVGDKLAEISVHYPEGREESIMKGYLVKTKSGSVVSSLAASKNSNVSHSIIFQESTPEQIADQLTLLEFNILKSIPISQFLAWSKKDKDQKAPALLSSVQWFNKMSQWISTEILKGDTKEQRSVIISRFIQIGSRLKANRNYNGLMQVLSSLNSASISRLKKTWGILPNTALTELKSMSDIMDPKDNFREYRAITKDATLPYIPFVGLLLTDLTYIDEANPDKLDGDLINFEKMQMLSRSLRDLQRALSGVYTISALPYVQSLLEKVVVWSEDELWAISKLREKLKQSEETEDLPERFDTKEFDNLAKAMMKKQEVEMTDYELSQRDWQLLLTGANVISCEKDQVIIKEGQVRSKCIYRMKTGRVRVEKLKANAPVVMDYIEPPTMFGEMSAFTGQVASASIVTDSEDVEYYAIEMSFVEKLFETEPGLQMRFYAKMAQKLADTVLKTKSAGFTEINGSTSNPVPITAEDIKLHPSEEKVDTRFNRFFHLEKNEIIIKEIPCFLRRKIRWHGRLFVTQKNLCFFSKNFGYPTKEQIPFATIQKIIFGEKDIQVTSTNKFEFVFPDKDQAKEICDIIHDLWHKMSPLASHLTPQQREEFKRQQLEKYLKEHPQRKPSLSQLPSIYRKGVHNAISEDDVHNTLSMDDWELILQGAKTVSFPNGAVVVQQGENKQRIYQISKGKCRVEIKKEGLSYEIGSLTKGDTFGELSFLRDKSSPVSVIAEGEDGIDLTVVEGYFINTLFSINPLLAGRFFKYLCAVLAQRVKEQDLKVLNSASKG